MASQTTLPPLVPFPEAAWRNHLVPEEWEACLDAWIALAGAHLSLSSPDFIRFSCKDESLSNFLASYIAESAQSPDTPSSNLPREKQLRKLCFYLGYKLLNVDHPPQELLWWDFLADFCAVFRKSHGGKAIAAAWKRHLSEIELSIAKLKVFLIKELDAGLNGDLKRTEFQLKRLNYLLHASPETAALFMAGSDFLDSLISCYKLMNPPLRKVIITTTYLCLIGLTEGEKPNLSSLIDQLFSLNAAAAAHKAGPTHVNDSLVAELVTVTPILKQVQQRIEASGSGSNRAKSVLKSLEDYKKAGGSGRPARLIKRKIIKGKGPDADGCRNVQVHIHKMSLVTQVQDLFPDLGSGFVVKLLDEYGDNVETVISHLLEGSLPGHLEAADRSESLQSASQVLEEDFPELGAPSHVAARHNKYDNDDFDQLVVDASRLHFGRKDADKTADDILEDRSNAPNKAAILSALAAFDSDDDERDDTYDIEDVGGTVDTANPEDGDPNAGKDARDEILFKAFQSTPAIFARDAATRRGRQRSVLKEEVGMTDEAIEGWALMLSRDPKRMRKLENKFSGAATLGGNQNHLASTRWQASPAGSGTEDSDIDGGNQNNRGRGGFRGRGAGSGGRGRGNVMGPSGNKDTEIARKKKDANKGSRANHNRRDGRARKMARGAFAGS